MTRIERGSAANRVMPIGRLTLSLHCSRDHTGLVHSKSGMGFALAFRAKKTSTGGLQGGTMSTGSSIGVEEHLFPCGACSGFSRRKCDGYRCRLLHRHGHA
jgi:hypothetical protein